MMGIGAGLRGRALGAAAWSVLAACGIAHAEPVARTEIHIEAQPLGDALRLLSEQAGVPVLFSEGAVSGRRAVAVQGRLEPEAALTRMLEGSGLVAVAGPGNALVVRAQAEPAGGSTAGAAPKVDRTVPAAQETPDEEVDAGFDGTMRIDAVTVTGTSLRGIAPESSPLDIYDREDILRSGAGSTEQFIRTLPQNFDGGSTEFASGGFPGDSNSERNNTYATGANLRGLGSGATLTLLDGNRLAPTSTVGDFVDLSLIPVAALQRVEVLSDGASSIYGGDAVAGVINFVLRDDFEGSETALRHGAATDGGVQEYRVSQSIGTGWQGGNLLAVYEFLDRGRLSLADRPGIAAPSLVGGGEVTGVGAFDLLPAQDRHSGLVSLRQSAGDRLDLSSTLLYSDRQVDSSGLGVGSIITTSRDRVGSESLAASFGADYEISPAWALAFDANLSRLRNEQMSQVLTPELRDPSRSRTESSLWSAGLLLNGDLFGLPGGTVKGSLGGQYRSEDFELVQSGSTVTRSGERDVSAVYGELFIPLVGPDNNVPLARRLELNLSARLDDYSDFGSTTNPKLGLLWSPAETLRLRSSWSTSFAPPSLGQAGARDRVGAVIPYDFIRGLLGIELPDPSLDGVNYLVATGTGTGLGPETSETFTAGADYENRKGIHSWSISTTYYDIAFEDRLGTVPVPGNLNFNFVPGFAWADPSLFPEGTIVFFPSQAEIDAVIADLSRPLNFVGGAMAVENIGFINRVNLVRNLSSTETSGFDLQLAYEADADLGLISAGLGANYIIDFVRQASETTPAIETLNTLYNPVDLQLRGRLGLARDGFSGTLFVNHVDSYRLDSTPGSETIDAWTTADLSLSYDFGPAGDRLLDGTRLVLSVTNLFDEAPPATPALAAFTLAGYDPANASPVGRFVALEFRKAF